MSISKKCRAGRSIIVINESLKKAKEQRKTKASKYN